jgi:hypothetical protein
MVVFSEERVIPATTTPRATTKGTIRNPITPACAGPKICASKGWLVFAEDVAQGAAGLA